MTNIATVTRIDNIHTFENLRDEWTNLLHALNEKDIFLTWEWLFAWWKNIGQHSKNQLCILAVRKDDTLIGIAPFMLNKKRKGFLSLRRLENLGNPECDVSGIISSDPEETIGAILNYLKKHDRDWDILELNELPGLSPATQQFLIGIENTKYRLFLRQEDHFYIPTSGDWSEYFLSLSKNLRHNLKRRKKRAEEMGAVTYSQFSGSTLSWEAFQTIFQVSKNSNFPDLYESERNKSFHKDLFELMQHRGWIQIETLTINHQPVAFHYGFLFDGKYEDWRGGMDNEYDALAPGKLLMMLALEERFKKGMRESDFLRGIYSYKMEWLPHPRKFLSIQVFNLHRITSRIAYLRMKYLIKDATMETIKND